MEFSEKAKIRIEHWMKHTADHVKEYVHFADELENSGYNDAARNIRQMAAITAKSSHCLENAFDSINQAS
jgi:hypothetical protein